MEGKVMVIDDQFGVRKLLFEVLRSEGLTVEVCENGIEGLKRLETFTPDLILLDMKMPGLDGLETFRCIKKILPRVKVIMMTAYGEMDIILEAMKLGAANYVTKPFDVVAVLQEVKEHIRQPVAV